MMNKKKMARKGYAYGSMVRSPMQPGNMSMSANPMMSRDDKMGGMMYGGMMKKKKKMAMGGENKKFAALAEPRDKITYADKIAGATRKG